MIPNYMKFFLTGLLALAFRAGLCQNFQLHYDFRHSIDPSMNDRNYPTFSFEYFKNIDTLGSGSFLLKIQSDLHGKNMNVDQVFVQVSQSLRFWKPPVYLSVTYSGGLGVTSDNFGYYIADAVGAGISYPFQWKGAWLATSLVLRYTAFAKPSYDPQFTFYFGRGIFNYRIFATGSFVFWSENRDQGSEFTSGQRGKKFAFFGDPQIWFKVKSGLSIGSRINVYYHIFPDNSVQFYPTLGTKYQF